jgi:hypothetical protein
VMPISSSKARPRGSVYPTAPPTTAPDGDR